MGWSTTSWVWGIAFKEVSSNVSKLVNSRKLEEVLWSVVNFKAMELRSTRDSGCREEEEEATRASIKGTKKGNVVEVEGISNSSSFFVLTAPLLVPPQTARSASTKASSLAKYSSGKKSSWLESRRGLLEARQCLESTSSKWSHSSKRGSPNNTFEFTFLEMYKLKCNGFIVTSEVNKERDSLNRTKMTPFGKGFTVRINLRKNRSLSPVMFIMVQNQFARFFLTNFPQGKLFIVSGTEEELQGDKGHMDHHLGIIFSYKEEMRAGAKTTLSPGSSLSDALVPKFQRSPYST